MVKYLKRLLAEATTQVTLLHGMPVNSSQGEVCTKMRDEFEKEMKRLQLNCF